MKSRLITWYIFVISLHIVLWYFISVFCSIYVNSNYSWIIGGVISIVIEYIGVKVMLSLIKAIARSIAQSYKNK